MGGYALKGKGKGEGGIGSPRDQSMQRELVRPDVARHLQGKDRACTIGLIVAHQKVFPSIPVDVNVLQPKPLDVTQNCSVTKPSSASSTEGQSWIGPRLRE